MSHPSKRQCRRIDKTLAEIHKILSNQNLKDRNYSKLCSLLQFILKEYCQTDAGLKILADVEFKDYFLIIIADTNLPSEVVNLILSILHNSSKSPGLFEDLLSSPIIDSVINRFLKEHKNFYRCLRFLSTCINYSATSQVQFPLKHFTRILDYLSESPLNCEKHIQILLELKAFFYVYIRSRFLKDWSIFVEENDVSLVISTMEQLLLLEGKFQHFECSELGKLAKLSMCLVVKHETPAHVVESLKSVVSRSITWLTFHQSKESVPTLLGLYEQRFIRTICYLSEVDRNQLFYSILIQENHLHRLKVASIYLSFCQEGSYRTHLVDEKFCSTFHQILSERVKFEYDSLLLEHLKLCHVVLSIFFTFNTGESLLKIAVESGIFNSLLSFVKLISQLQEQHSGTVLAECRRLLPKTYFLLQKTTDYKCLDHKSYETFIKILKRFKCLFCLNYLLYLSQNVPFAHLSYHSFISLVYHQFSCSNLSAEEQYYDLPTTRSVPRAMTSLDNLPECGRMILSNVLQNLEFSSFCTPWAISEGILLLRKVTLVKTFLQKDIPKRIEDSNGTVQQYSNILINTCNLINWLQQVLEIDEVSFDASHQVRPNFLKDKNGERSSDIVVCNKNTRIVVEKTYLINSSPIFKCMFGHQFRESLKNCLVLNYLSDDALACFCDYLSGNGDMICFPADHSSTPHSYPWSVAFQLLYFSTMFEIDDLYRIVFNAFRKCESDPIHKSVFMFSLSHCTPKWILAVSEKVNPKFVDRVDVPIDKLKSLSSSLYTNFAKPLLSKFCEKKT